MWETVYGLKTPLEALKVICDFHSSGSPNILQSDRSCILGGYMRGELDFVLVHFVRSRQSKCSQNLKLVTTVLIGTIRILNQLLFILYRSQRFIKSRLEHNFGRNQDLVLLDIRVLRATMTATFRYKFF